MATTVLAIRKGAARLIGDVEPILRNIDPNAQGACNSGKIG
jgi:hypothetical protein